MATLFRESNGSYRVQFIGPDRKRKGLRLGAVTEDQAEGQRAYVEDILRSRRNGHPPQAATTRWLAGTSNDVAARLVKVGLIEPRPSTADVNAPGPRLAAFLDEVIAGRSDAK